MKDSLPLNDRVRKNRDSNMELLRVTAMLLILIIHASYRALPFPDAAAINADPSSALLQLLARSMAIMGVDVFVMLSGWYGIRPRFLRLIELVFQLLFFGVLCLLVEYVIVGRMPCSVSQSFKTLLLLNEGSYWFIKCYLGLYIFAPVLNSFVEHVSRCQFSITLCLIFGFQFVFGWVFEATTWLKAGYSLPSFFCLYLLARYMRIHRPAFTQFSRWLDLGIYLAIVIMVTAVAFVMRKKFEVGGVLYFYNSPTTILSACFLLLFFSKLALKSRLVNWVAISSLAIYLTHSNDFLYKYYDGSVQKWFYGESRTIFVIYTALLISAVFIGSTFLDKVRLMLWDALRYQSSRLIRIINRVSNIKITSVLFLALAMLLVSCKGDQDYYVYNHTADTLYVLPGTGPDLSSKDRSADDFFLVTPTKVTHIRLHPETNTGDGLWLLVLKKKTYDMLKDEDFRSDLYDKKLYYPFSRLETKRFEVRIYDKTLE